MNISIKITVPEEAEKLSKIQKAAFKPLYEEFHDEGNPYLRGPEDILWRLNKNYRHFTILYDGKIIGGIFYRLCGKRVPGYEMEVGDYYLQRVYIHPDYQNKGIAREAILLCEKEFADAKFYYVDFPEVMEKNRKCYQSAGYCDIGERITMEGAPTLAMFKKTVSEIFDPAGVSLPIIYEVEKNELGECLDVIHQSFRTVADQFGLTKENSPKHTSFIPLSFLETQKNWGLQMYALYAGKKIIGYMSLSKESDDAFEIHNLAVLPEYRHKGFGKLLLEHAKNAVQAFGGNKIKISIIEENTVLKNWCIENGFVFSCGYMERSI